MIVRHALLLWLLGLCLAPLAEADTAVESQSIEYAGSEGEMPARLHVPAGSGRLPGVLLLHTLAGPGPNLETFGRRLAAAGYVVLAPDVFALHDFGPDGRTDHPLVVGDARGALRHLRRHPRVAPDRIGLVGFSFGGRLAVILGALEPDGVRAIVVYYAIASHADLPGPVAPAGARAVPLAQRVPSLRAPVIIHHGEADTNVPVGQARLLHQALTDAGRPSALYLYPGADHLFNFALGPDARLDPEAERLSWQRTVEFLGKNLAP